MRVVLGFRIPLQNPKIYMFMKKIADKACALKRGKAVRYRCLVQWEYERAFTPTWCQRCQRCLPHHRHSECTILPPNGDNGDDWLAQYSKQSSSEKAPPRK